MNSSNAGVDWMLAALALCGLIITWWARIALGRLWSSGVTRKVQHKVITAGPYRVVRHPIYAGIILSIAATAAMRGTEAAYLGAALIALGLFIKSHVEEQFLGQALGEDRYNAYAWRATTNPQPSLALNLVARFGWQAPSPPSSSRQPRKRVDVRGRSAMPHVVRAAASHTDRRKFGSRDDTLPEAQVACAQAFKCRAIRSDYIGIDRFGRSDQPGIVFAHAP